MTKRILLALACIFGLTRPSVAQMAQAQACVTTAPAAANPQTIALGAAATAGDLITVQLKTQDTVRTVMSIDDDGTTTYAAGPGAIGASGAGRAQIWYGIAAGANAGLNVVVTHSGTPSNTVFTICEWSNAASDQSGATGNNGATDPAGPTHNSGSVTPATPTNLVLVTIAHTSGAWTYDGAFTQIAAGTNYYFGYVAQTSAAAQESNVTSVTDEVSSQKIVAFSGGGGDAPKKPSRLLLLGVGER